MDGQLAPPTGSNVMTSAAIRTGSTGESDTRGEDVVLELVRGDGQILTVSGQPYPFSPFAADGQFAISTPLRRFENLGAGSYLLQLRGGTSPQAFEMAAGALAVVTLP